MSALTVFGQPQSGSPSGIEGAVTVSPAHPGPTREGIPTTAPLANAPFTVRNENGEVASFITDDEGKFQVSLSPGHYTISMKERRVRHCGPWDVDVVAGKITKIEWRCDTGMR